MLCELGQRVILAIINISFILRNSGARITSFPRKQCIITSSVHINRIDRPSFSRKMTLQMSDDAVIPVNKKKNSLQLFVDGRTTTASLVPFDAILLPNSVEVKSLIWEYDGCPLIVVLDESKHVDIELLALYIGVSSTDLMLASPERAVQLGGKVKAIMWLCI